MRFCGIHLRVISQRARNLLFCTESWKFAVNSLNPRWNRRHSTDAIFKRIFLNGNLLISINISLKFFFPNGPIDTIPALVQIMANYLNQCWPDSLTHICGTRGVLFKNIPHPIINHLINMCSTWNNVITWCQNTCRAMHQEVTAPINTLGGRDKMANIRRQLFFEMHFLEWKRLNLKYFLFIKMFLDD